MKQCISTAFSFGCVCVPCAKLASLHLHVACQCGCCHYVFFCFFTDFFGIFLDEIILTTLLLVLILFSLHYLLSSSPPPPQHLSLLTSSSAPSSSSLSSTSHSIAVLFLFLLLRSAPLSLVPPTLTVKRKSAQEDVCVSQSREGNSWHSSSGSGGGGELSLALTPIKMSLLPFFFLLLFPSQTCLATSCQLPAAHQCLRPCSLCLCMFFAFLFLCPPESAS